MTNKSSDNCNYSIMVQKMINLFFWPVSFCLIFIKATNLGIYIIFCLDKTFLHKKYQSNSSFKIQKSSFKIP